MDKFSMWTGLAHTTLTKHYPDFKRSQAAECLAAWLGHRTYASLRVQDLGVLNEGIKHAIVDALTAVKRAEAFGFQLSREQWREVELTLTPSGISGMWLTGMDSMSAAARLAFEDNSHPDATEIARAVGLADGRWVEKVVRHTPEETLPKQLWFTVHGSVRAFNDEGSLATPVLAEVMFRRVGARLYWEGEIQAVIQNGEPCPYEPNFEGDDYGGGDYGG